MSKKRAFIIVLDSCGIGEEPDAHEFGDAGCNTMRSISQDPAYRNDTMMKLGLGNIDGQSYLGTVEKPLASIARLQERSRGKDTTIGHWEIAGIQSDSPMPTYPNGFPEEVLEPFRKATGHGVICNLPYSGTDAIRDYGEEHMRTGDLIVYTSADSVFQIAANEALVPPEKLYEYCRIAREILTGPHAVGRVIARPFVGTCKEDFKRTANRHDFSLLPPRDTVLDAVKKAGKTVYAIGKINDIFAGAGITEYVYTHSNEEGMQRTLEALDKDFEGICFTNLVDYDMLYGHRRDVTGYAKAFTVFDEWLAGFMDKMQEDDIVIITADHGCDPADTHHTDHTREYVPFIMYGKKVKARNYLTQPTFAAIAATVADFLGVDYECNGAVLR
ncbi:MAG: phosphopentomutase [Lachnospiraceae bacterium]|nr:phosphopentomutase [Lachnospiraceae bacterium]